MTAIVGLIHEGRVWMGGDSATTYSDATRRSDGDTKVKLIGDMLIGCAGSARSSQIIHYSFKPPKHPQRVSPLAYISGPWMKQLQKSIKDQWAEFYAHEGDFEFLIGYRGQLFLVDGHFGVSNTRRSYDAIGCGANLALGSMYSTEGLSDPEKRITIALSAASEFSAAVSPPFVILESRK